MSTPESTRRADSKIRLLWIVAGVAVVSAGAGIFLSRSCNPTVALPPASSSVVVEKPSPTLLVAVRDLARLETNQMHYEKVVDLTDKQSRFFGLVEGQDALLLVASGDVTMGVDLGKVQDTDIQFDVDAGVATMTLPPPEIFSASLDEKNTHVFKHATDTFGTTNPDLETKARQSAVQMITDAAKTPQAADQSKKQAERELRALATALGAKQINFVWKTAPKP